MNVKLISHSQTPLGFIDGPDDYDSILDLVAYCARVSNPDNQNNKETNEKLVKYLMKHKHWSPLEMVSVCLEVETTRYHVANKNGQSIDQPRNLAKSVTVE